MGFVSACRIVYITDRARSYITATSICDVKMITSRPRNRYAILFLLLKLLAPRPVWTAACAPPRRYASAPPATAAPGASRTWTSARSSNLATKYVTTPPGATNANARRTSRSRKTASHVVKRVSVCIVYDMEMRAARKVERVPFQTTRGRRSRPRIWSRKSSGSRGWRRGCSGSRR